MTTSYVSVARARGLAVVGLVVAALVGVGAFLVGLVPFVVEPEGRSDPVSCGSTWFRASGLPTECYTEVDVWASAAKGGLVVAAVLVLLSAAAALSARPTRS
jgi:hypothetical protein